MTANIFIPYIQYHFFQNLFIVATRFQYCEDDTRKAWKEVPGGMFVNKYKIPNTTLLYKHDCIDPVQSNIWSETVLFKEKEKNLESSERSPEKLSKFSEDVDRSYIIRRCSLCQQCLRFFTYLWLQRTTFFFNPTLRTEHAYSDIGRKERLKITAVFV